MQVSQPEIWPGEISAGSRPAVINGVVVVGSTVADDQRFDAESGRSICSRVKVRKDSLPAAGMANPVSYEVNGEQYVVLTAGGQSMGSTMGDSVVAYKLKH